MIYQTSVPDSNFEHVGCAFDSLAYYREKSGGPLWSPDELYSAWNRARYQDILDSNFVIQDWQKLADFLDLGLHYEGKFPTSYSDRSGKFIICAWYNPNTTFTHFVVGDSKPVEWDPIEGGSRTVREGHPIAENGLRVFTIL